jgi:copper chaperone
MKTKKINIEGMSCNHCVKAVEIELEELGVDSFEVTIGSAVIKYNENKITDNDINKAVDEAGFKVVV